METTKKFTSADLALMPDDGLRYEIIEGDLYVSKLPGVEHQYVCSRLVGFLADWSEGSGTGVALIAPGLVFSDDDDVAPDVVWVSHERMRARLTRRGISPERPSRSSRCSGPARGTNIATGRPSSSSTRGAGLRSTG